MYLLLNCHQNFVYVHLSICLNILPSSALILQSKFFLKKELKSIVSYKEVAVALIKTSKLNGINTPWVYVVSECVYVNML